jgi:hypothetical protein
MPVNDTHELYLLWFHSLLVQTWTNCTFKIYIYCEVIAGPSGRVVEGWVHTCNVTTYRNTVSWQCGRDSWPRNVSKVVYAVTSPVHTVTIRCYDTRQRYKCVPILRRRTAATRLLRLWVRIPPGAWMFVSCVVCRQVEVSAMSWSLVQRSPTDCGASLSVI